MTNDDLMREGVRCGLASIALTGPEHHVMILRAQCYIAAAERRVMGGAARNVPISSREPDHG